jgi:MmyB-like transcription regulator ligand binding domain
MPFTSVSKATARFVFLDPRAERFYLDWDRVAAEVVALLRSEAGRDPYDRALSDLVGELSTQSEAFRTKWAAHNVRFHDTGIKRMHHPVVGDLELTYEAMELSADTGLTMFAYTAESGSSLSRRSTSSPAGQQRATRPSRLTPPIELHPRYHRGRRAGIQPARDDNDARFHRRHS